MLLQATKNILCKNQIKEYKKCIGNLSISAKAIEIKLLKF